MSTLNFLTWDIEEWYHANYDGVDNSGYRRQATNLDQLVERILELCAHHGVLTTCFVLGTVAEEKPGVVRRLHAAGHEIASHGYAHGIVYRMSPREFRADVERSRCLLEDLTGSSISGFRAPSFSVRQDTLSWFYPTLEEAGYRYSSSVFPGQTFLYGVPGFPQSIHYPEVDGRRSAILEIPVPLVRVLGRDLGLYIRLFPGWCIRREISRRNDEGQPTVLYVHPREIDPDQPRLSLGRAQALIHYWGISSCYRKLDSVLGAVPASFQRMGELLTAPDL